MYCMYHTTIRDIDVQKESPVAVEKYEESSFYLTALASATSQLVKAKTMKKVSGIEPLVIPVSKISGRSSGGKSDAFDEGDDEYDDDDDDEDDDFYEDDEDDDNNGYDDEDDNEDENEGNGNNENGRSSIGLGISEWRDITVANKTFSSKVDSGDAKEPLDLFQEAALDLELSNTLTKKSSAAHDKEKEKALTLSLVETIRRTSNYDKVFTLK